MADIPWYQFWFLKNAEKWKFLSIICIVQLYYMLTKAAKLYIKPKMDGFALFCKKKYNM